MERLTSNSYYFDFNATSPLQDSVRDFLVEGDVFLGNSSSSHSIGRRSNKHVQECKRYLIDCFGLNDSKHRVLFHSGATEGINTLILNGEGEFDYFFHSSVDHAAVVEIGTLLKRKGKDVSVFGVNRNGDFNICELEELLKKVSDPSRVLVNYTWVNNETGVVWPLENIIKLKEKYNFKVHVDATQAPGKIDAWNKLFLQIECFTFSGHKFGALVGIGFSFISSDYNFSPLLIGGGQQSTLRSGTINVLGIYSLKLALENIKSRYDFIESSHGRRLIEDGLINQLGDKLKILGLGASFRTSNTISFHILERDSNFWATKFDMNNIFVGTGSACSTGVSKSSRIMMAMGYSDSEAKSFIRLSFSPYLNRESGELYLNLILKVLN